MNSQKQFKRAIVALKELYNTTADGLMVPNEEIYRLEKKFLEHVINVMRNRLGEPEFECSYDSNWNTADNAYSSPIPDAHQEYTTTWDCISDLYYENWYIDGRITTSQMKDIFQKIVTFMKNMVRLNRINKLGHINILETENMFSKNLKEDDRYYTFHDRDDSSSVELVM